MNVVVSLTPHQKQFLPVKPFQHVRMHLQQSKPMPAPNTTATDEERNQPKSERIGSSVSPKLHLRLKELADETGCSMSVAVIRILQLPE